MLGWHIAVFRLEDPNPLLAAQDVPALTALFPTESDKESLLAGLKKGKRLAVWQADPYGLKWVKDLIEQNQALLLLNGGYPRVYIGQAQHLIPPVVAGPPSARLVWGSDSGDVLTEKWEGKTVIDHAETERASPREWLMVEAWDES